MFLGEHAFSTHVSRDLTELFEGGFKGLRRSPLANTSGIGEVVGLFEALVTELEDVEAGPKRLNPSIRLRAGRHYLSKQARGDILLIHRGNTAFLGNIWLATFSAGKAPNSQ